MEKVICIEYYHVYDIQGVAYSEECGSADLIKLGKEMSLRGMKADRDLDEELIKNNGGVVDIPLAIEIIEGRGYGVSMRQLNFLKEDIEKALAS